MSELIGFHLPFEEALEHPVSQCYVFSNYQFIYSQRVPLIIKKKLEIIYQLQKEHKLKNKILVIHCGYPNHMDSKNREVLEKSAEDSLNLMKIASEIQKAAKNKVYVLFHVYNLSQAQRCKRLLKYTPKNITLVFEQTSKINLEDFIKFKKEVGCKVVIDTAHIWASGSTIDDLLDSGIMPTIIHLNGNSLNKGVRQDKHTDILGPVDQVFNRESLKRFFRKFRGIPMICERREEMYDTNYLDHLKRYF